MTYVNGKATFSFNKTKVIDGLNVDLSMSLENRERFLQIVLNKIHHYAPWTKICDKTDVYKTDPTTMLRDCLDGARAYMSAILDSECVHGHSIYHYSEISETYTCYANHIAHTYFHIPVGDTYCIFPETLTICITGDGGRMKRVPVVTGTIPFVFVRCLALNDSLQHCKHGGICCLASKLNDKDSLIESYVPQIIDKIGKQGSFSIYSQKAKCWCVYNYECTTNGDWPWLYQMVNRCISATGKYPFPGLIRYKDGVPKMVENTIFKKYHALVCDCIDENDGKSMNDLMDEKWTGYRLADDEVCKYLSGLVEIDFENEFENTNLTPKQEREARKNIAYRYQHGLLYQGNYNNNDGVFDVCHCWWTIVLRILTILLTCVWCNWHWERNQVIYIFSLLGVEWITQQVTDFIDEINPKGNDNIVIVWLASGDINKNIICGLPDTLIAAANIAASRNNDTEIGLCCVMIRVLSLMRKAFGVLLTDKFEMKENGDLPDAIYDMIHCVDLATYLAYHLFDSLVCFCN